MRFPRWLFWLLLYAGGTFGWMVFFEHGPGWDRFQAGAQVELTRAWEKLRLWAQGPPSPPGKAVKPLTPAPSANGVIPPAPVIPATPAVPAKPGGPVR